MPSKQYTLSSLDRGRAFCRPAHSLLDTKLGKTVASKRLGGYASDSVYLLL